MLTFEDCANDKYEKQTRKAAVIKRMPVFYSLLTLDEVLREVLGVLSTAKNTTSSIAARSILPVELELKASNVYV